MQLSSLCADISPDRASSKTCPKDYLRGYVNHETPLKLIALVQGFISQPEPRFALIHAASQPMQDTENPILFPEARDFYSNIGDATYRRNFSNSSGAE